MCENNGGPSLDFSALEDKELQELCAWHNSRHFTLSKPEMNVSGFFDCLFRIEHAHDNNYQVLLPDGNEIFRLIDSNPTQLIVV